jgi:hypothetical protein
MTIIELSMVVALLGIVVASLLAVMNGAQTNLEREISRSTSNDQVRLAANSIDREVRSGNVLYDPANENYAAGDVVPGMSMRVYTQSNAPTRGGWWCVQWRITSAGELQSRNWSPQWQSNPSALVSGWRIVATDVMNRTDNVTAFTRPSPGAVNIVSVILRSNGDPAGRKGSTVEVRQSVTGRNQIFFPPNNHEECGPQVPDPSLTGVGGSRVPPY